MQTVIPAKAGIQTQQGTPLRDFYCLDWALAFAGVMKGWKRLWKLWVIEEMNPDWEDLYEGLF